MSYYLMALVIVATISVVLAFCYKWTQSDILPDEVTIDLSGDDNALLNSWYETHLALSEVPVDNHHDDYATAARFLARLYGLRVDKEELVLGENLQEQYHNLSGRSLLASNWFDIRTILGKNGEIAIINNALYQNHLRRTNTLDMREISTIMNANLDKAGRDFVTDILRWRWDELSQLYHPDLIMDDRLSGSYAYFVPVDNNLSALSNIGGIPNVIGAVTNSGIRINLLCSNIEFVTFLFRYRKQAELAIANGDLSYRYSLPSANIYINS